MARHGGVALQQVIRRVAEANVLAKAFQQRTNRGQAAMSNDRSVVDRYTIRRGKGSYLFYPSVEDIGVELNDDRKLRGTGENFDSLNERRPDPISSNAATILDVR